MTGLPVSPNWGTKIGVLTPGTNMTVEEELWSMRVPGATIATARIQIDATDWSKPDGIKKFVEGVNDRLPEAAKSAMQVEPALLMLGISSSNLWGGLAGNEEIKEKIYQQTGREMITPVDALVKIADLYGVKSVGVVTPYPEAANDKVTQFFSEFGVSILAQRGLKITSPIKIGEVSEQTLREALRMVCVDGVEALFQLGTDLKMAKLAAQAEGWLGKPTFSVNTATWWRTVRSAGIDAKLDGWGSLFADH